MKAVVLFLLVTAMLGMGSCNKFTIINTPISDAVKSDFNFLPGTYWIYKDSITGTLDSFYVVANIPGQKFESGSYHQEYSIDYIDISISSVDINTGGSNNSMQQWKLHYVGAEIDISYVDQALYNGILDYTPVEYMTRDSLVAFSRPYDTDTSVIDSTYLAYVIGGSVYAHVISISHRYTGNIGVNEALFSFNDKQYIAPKVGLVKIVLHHPLQQLDRVWELQRSSIVLK